MPLFLTLRDEDGKPLVTAMLPPNGKRKAAAASSSVRATLIPYPEHADAIAALGDHFGITLDRSSCYPYRR